MHAFVDSFSVGSTKRGGHDANCKAREGQSQRGFREVWACDCTCAFKEYTHAQNDFSLVNMLFLVVWHLAGLDWSIRFWLVSPRNEPKYDHSLCCICIVWHQDWSYTLNLGFFPC